MQLQTSDDVGDSMSMAQFRPNAVSSPWSAPPAAPGSSSKIAGAYTKADHDTEYYDREVPTNFAGDTGGVDTLMRSLITNYSLEGKTDGAPNHHFYLTKDGVKSVAKEVVGSHFGWTGKKGDDFVQK